jgi:DNA-binding beta-propeller fold protein YncE
VKDLGPLAVGSQAYVATLDADPTGRYLYYVPGAHGGSDRDGAAIIQFDTQTKQKKVIAFLHPFYQAKYGFTLKGTYSVAIDPAGDKLYVTWNVNRGSKAWDSVGLTVVHIPESERPE